MKGFLQITSDTRHEAAERACERRDYDDATSANESERDETA